jgi:hypothetical protein
MTAANLRDLPGADLIQRGLADLQAGHRTEAALLVAIARSRLTRAGLLPPVATPPASEPERELYALLRQREGDAYSRYNAMIRELVSFENALDHRLKR